VTQRDSVNYNWYQFHEADHGVLKSSTTANRGASVRCLKNLEPQHSTITDPRDNQKYQVVQIGSQLWMAENLNYPSSNSWCYNNNSYYCSLYGRLYNHGSASVSCPVGWHLPSAGAWDNLISHVGANPGQKLKASIVWNGTNQYGFTVLPAGISTEGSSGFSSIGLGSLFWSVTQRDSVNYNWYQFHEADHGVLKSSTTAKRGASVRCLKN
jgi:uncharacterized protein (TIGR02145 family)